MNQHGKAPDLRGWLFIQWFSCCPQARKDECAVARHFARCTSPHTLEAGFRAPI
ncbi:hypothetical protein AB691_3606 [Stutzerimonas stutzeri]|nr:hypothetical protein AB691_3606 [Stutzerimonas stutzeri]